MKPQRHGRRLSVLSGVTLLGMLGVACGDGSATPETTATVTTTTVAVTTSAPSTTLAPTTIATTTTVPASEILEERLGDLLAQWQADNGAPGAAMTVLLPDGSEVTVANGVRNLVTETPIARDEFWRFASVTKPMTSAVVLRLVEQGLIDLDEPVATYLGEDWAQGYVLDGVDYGPLVTVAQTLNHTDGFAEFAFDPGFFFVMSTRLDVPLDPTDVVAWGVDRGPQYVPGEAYVYNTVGHIVAGLVIEAVTGRPAEQVLREELFDLVDASDVYLTPREFPPASVPAGYVQGELRFALDLLPGLTEYREIAAVGDYYDVTAVPQEVLTSAAFTGGGLEAQTDDVARVLRGMFDGTVLTPESIEAFTTTVLDTTYGLGIDVDEVDGLTVYSHGGGTVGFRSHALYVPELDVAMAMSSNLIPLEPDARALADEVVRVVRDVLDR